VSVIVDSSVLVAALVDSGPDGGWAENVMENGDLYAPELVQVETTNLLRRLELARKITRPVAEAAYEDLMQLDIELFAFAPFAERIWELRPTITSYDAWYVSLAEATGFPLATLDGRLAKASGPKCKFLIPQPG
jgi:predicted nucleic acid-binding protein